MRLRLPDPGAHALLGGDEILQARPLQLPAEPGHVDGEGVLIHVGVGLPQTLHEGFPAHDFPLLLQKGLENAAFIFGQGQPPAPVQKGGCRRIQNGSPVLQGRLRRAEVVGPAQQSLNLGREHIQVEGLGQEVVASQVHGHDDVEIV